MERKKLTPLKAVSLLIPVLLVLFLQCNNPKNETIEVTATAYNSLPEQTHAEHSDVAAWGDKLEPGVKGIAVSRDLINIGLTYNTEVKIEGLPGTYTVMDKMNKRWTKRIDIYMGQNRDRAIEWGRKKVEITWKQE
jgi:3D (Asp-Asp-Asp) domain-containing protein